jgi:hypothetical protein
MPAFGFMLKTPACRAEDRSNKAVVSRMLSRGAAPFEVASWHPQSLMRKWGEKAEITQNFLDAVRE